MENPSQDTLETQGESEKKIPNGENLSNGNSEENLIDFETGVKFGTSKTLGWCPDEKQMTYLDEILKHGDQKTAMRKAKINTKTVRYWRGFDAFRAWFDTQVVEETRKNILANYFTAQAAVEDAGSIQALKIANDMGEKVLKILADKPDETAISIRETLRKQREEWRRVSK